MQIHQSCSRSCALNQSSFLSTVQRSPSDLIILATGSWLPIMRSAQLGRDRHQSPGRRMCSAPLHRMMVLHKDLAMEGAGESLDISCMHACNHESRNHLSQLLVIDSISGSDLPSQCGCWRTKPACVSINIGLSTENGASSATLMPQLICLGCNYPCVITTPSDLCPYTMSNSRFVLSKCTLLCLQPPPSLPTSQRASKHPSHTNLLEPTPGFPCVLTSGPVRLNPAIQLHQTCSGVP